MGKQRVNARLVLRPEEHEIGFAAFQPHRIIALDFDHSKLRAALRDLITKGKIVAGVQNGQGENTDEEYAFHGRLKTLGFGAQAYEGRLLSFPQFPVQSIMAVWGGETGVLHAKT
jgi:hypothetical protein